MIRLGLRLTLAGGREAATRLAMIVIAVAIGVGLLLSTLAGLKAVNAQNARYAWLETGAAGSSASGAAPTVRDPLWWRLSADYFQGREIGRVDVAATGPDSPVPPGIVRLPGPGQFYASPALTDLLRRTPAAELGDRYPGTQAGTIGAAALPSPGSLLIVIGRTAADVSREPGAHRVLSISTTVPSKCNDACVLGVGVNKNGIILILSVVVAALLFPVLVFIAGATRLSAARREQRFAAMRLVGATPRQISVIATVESAVATVIGVAAGFGVFFALRPAVAKIPFTGETFFTGDLSLSMRDVLLVALGIPVAAAVAARLALRRVSISPLGVTRRVSPRAPRAWRLVPLLAGIAELSYFAYVRDIGAHSGATPTFEAVAFLGGVLLIMAGLVIAGPWLTMLGSRIVARRASRPATLIAARRLADNPQAGFRAISGLVLAVFVGSCATGIIAAIVAYNGGSAGFGAAGSGTLIDTFWEPQQAHRTTSIPAATMNRLSSIHGVTGVAVIRDQRVSLPDAGPNTIVGTAPVQEVVSCAELAGVPAFGHCPPGAATVLISPDYGYGLGSRSAMPERTWPPADVSVTRLQHLPVDTVAVGTDGSSTAVERARTVLDRAFTRTFAPETLSESQADNNRLLDDYRRLAEVVILASLPIAGCSLAVSIAGGLAERKRPFSLLRLAGAPLGILRRVIGLEAAAPLMITAAASAGAGLLAAHLFLRAQLNETLQAPGMSYYAVLLAGLAASTAVIASTLPLINRITGPEVARNE